MMIPVWISPIPPDPGETGPPSLVGPKPLAEDTGGSAIPSPNLDPESASMDSFQDLWLDLPALPHWEEVPPQPLDFQAGHDAGLDWARAEPSMGGSHYPSSEGILSTQVVQDAVVVADGAQTDSPIPE